MTDKIDAKIAAIEKKRAKNIEKVKQLETETDKLYEDLNSCWDEKAKLIVREKRQLFVVYNDDRPEYACLSWNDADDFLEIQKRFYTNDARIRMEEETANISHLGALITAFAESPCK